MTHLPQGTVRGADSSAKNSVERPTALDRQLSECIEASTLHCKGAKLPSAGAAEQPVSSIAATSSRYLVVLRNIFILFYMIFKSK
jgi:hypothetical protein